MHRLPFAPRRAALFLDFDGTLVEIAARPDEIAVPPTLPPLLLRLATALDGALAVVSGRPLAQLDQHLPIPIAKAGDHGASLRLRPDTAVIGAPLAVPPDAWRHQAEALAATFPGAFVEQKAHGFVLHYRLAPSAAAAARAALTALVGASPEFILMPARMAWEVMPRGVSKGTAVGALLARPPFAGRVPVFIGDDVTDEAGIAAVEAAGGIGWRVQDRFGTPTGVRAWLAQLDATLRAQAS